MWHLTVPSISNFARYQVDEQGWLRQDSIKLATEDRVCFEFAHMRSVGCLFERRTMAAREMWSGVLTCGGFREVVVESIKLTTLSTNIDFRRNWNLGQSAFAIPSAKISILVLYGARNLHKIHFPDWDKCTSRTVGDANLA